MAFVYTYDEIYECVKTYFKFEHMKLLQNYENLASIVSAMFGGGKKKPNNVYNATNANELISQMRRSVNGGK